ncbi:metal-dependent hydrolase [Galenea microaerophila]
MIGRNHIVFGAGSTVLIGKAMGLDFAQIGAMLPFSVLGSLLPDIDLMQSRLKKNWVIKLLTLPFVLLGHRTWTHSILALLIVSLPIFFMPNEMLKLMWGGMIIGFASHLIGDWMTPKGVPLFYPMKQSYRAPFTFKSGALVEYIVALIPLLMSALWTFYLH